MNTLIAGFIGPQEIILILFLLLILPVTFFAVFLVVRAIRKSKKKE